LARLFAGHHNNISVEQQIAEYKDHDVTDIRVEYVKNNHGELMYAKMRAADNADFFHLKANVPARAQATTW
jgi:hypothetical protein